MAADLMKFARTLPYASNIFGVYQPLLGWRSKRMVRRVQLGLRADFDPAVRAIAAALRPNVSVEELADVREFTVARIAIASTAPPVPAQVKTMVDSFVTQAIVKRINDNGLDLSDDDIWDKLVSRRALDELLDEVKADPALHATVVEQINALDAGRDLQVLGRATRDAILGNESVMAGTLSYLFEHGQLAKLREIFEVVAPPIDLDTITDMRRLVDPLETFDPRTDLDRVGLSPVGQVHLFREYFFEFDTFLGSPVQHIWLSPGSTLELVEVSTRKTTIERTVESASESIIKTDKSSTYSDELSEAIKTENQNNTKFASSVSGGVTGSGDVGVYACTAHAEASASFGTDQTSKSAKEKAYKQMHTQSTKLSSEIKQSFKTTFRTLSETTETSSKRYVLANSTEKLLNYELRRKMRQVGVQVEDIGSQLCWQTYVDVPGSALGLSNLVHVAQPPDYSSLHEPAAPPAPPSVEKDLTLTLGFQGTGHDNDTNAHYVEDSATSDFGHPDNGDINDKIKIVYRGNQAPVVAGYDLKDVFYVGAAENKEVSTAFSVTPTTNAFDVRLRSVKFDGDAITIQVKLSYEADDATLTAIKTGFAKDMAAYDADRKELARRTMLEEARDRVKAASSVQPRPFGDLREEERIIVYRELIRDLLEVGALPDSARVRHVLSELISSMFDVDKMLYFVAPDWWRPRKYVASQQNLGTSPGAGFTSTDLVTWNGVDGQNRPSYYVTEDSAPARLGSSIGWIMQLDGDDSRNAFLNAPWVKAVVPIRPGKELAALAWLSNASVEGADSLDARYQAADDAEHDEKVAFLESFPWDDAPERARYTSFAAQIAANPDTIFLSIRDALRYLAIRVKLANADLMKVRTEKIDGDDVSYLPTEKVFEHGFDPLVGGFNAGGEVPYQVFSQWVEVLPTDQVVAVQVEYDPKTGQLL